MPGFSDRNAFCVYEITSNGDSAIVLQVDSFHLESCCDAVDIFDGK